MANVTATFEFYNGTTWTDITAVVQFPRTWRMGMMNASPTDRVGVPGTNELPIKNVSPYIYSPDSASVATGWAVGAKIRVKLVSGGNTRYWMYRIKEINPAMGQYRDRRVAVTSADYLEELSKRKISGLTVQTNKRADELFTTLIAQMPFAPTNTSYDTALYLHPYAFGEERDEDTFCMTIAQKIAQSGMCYIYQDGDSTAGETLVLEAPEGRYRAAVSATFSDNMIEMSTRHSRDDIYNTAKTTVSPIVVATTLGEVGTADEEIVLEPSETKTITVRYVDSGTSKRVTALSPVCELGTDLNMYSKTGGLGTNLNANLTVTPTDNGNSMTLVLANGSSTQKGYIPSIAVRGYMVTSYNKQDIKQTDSTSVTAYGESTLSFVLPYCSNPETAKTIATEFVNRHKDPHTQILSMKYNANRSDTFMGYALTLGIGDKIEITETVTGLSTNEYVINGCEYELKAGGILDVTYILERAYGEGNTYFVLDTSALDGTHILMPL